MHKVIPGTLQRRAGAPSRSLATKVLAYMGIMALLTLGVGEASLTAAPPVSPPAIDVASGKIVDRLGGETLDPISAGRGSSSRANSVTYFAYGLDLQIGEFRRATGAAPQQAVPAPVKVAIQEATKQTPAKRTTEAGVTRPKAVIVAEAAPLPPVRPASAAPVAADHEPIQAEAPGLLGGVLPSGLQPSQLLPSGREAWNRVASLGESLVDRLSH